MPRLFSYGPEPSAGCSRHAFLIACAAATHTKAYTHTYVHARAFRRHAQDNHFQVLSEFYLFKCTSFSSVWGRSDFDVVPAPHHHISCGIKVWRRQLFDMLAVALGVFRGHLLSLRADMAIVFSHRPSTNGLKECQHQETNGPMLS